jgi:hypothetical protein
VFSFKHLILLYYYSCKSLCEKKIKEWSEMKTTVEEAHTHTHEKVFWQAQEISAK